MLIAHKNDLDYERRVTSEEGVEVFLSLSLRCYVLGAFNTFLPLTVRLCVILLCCDLRPLLFN